MHATRSALSAFAGYLCQRCEQPRLARIDDARWSCFGCGFSELRGVSGSGVGL